MKIIKIFKDILAPKKCYSCNDEGSFLCKRCLEDIGGFTPLCYICKEKSKNFENHFYCKNDFVYYDKIIILTHYKNKTIKKLIGDAKYYKRKDILEDLSHFLGQRLFENIDENEEIIFLSTPMYFWKKLFRGYNQSEILAKNIGEIYKKNYSFNIIKKVKKTKQQSFLSKIERLENLNGAFTLNKLEFSKYKNKTFVIVDDVISTGATINEISKLLKKSGALKVYGLCLASD